MSGEFDSRKDSQSTKFERRPQIFINLSCRELRDSKLSGLHAVGLILEVIFVTLTENFSFEQITLRDLRNISTPPEIAVGTYFHARTWH